MIATETLIEEYGHEVAALVVACRIFVGSASVAQFQHVVSVTGFNWDNFYLLAGRHSIRPIVFRAVHTCNIPEDIKQKFQQISRRFALRNLDHARELVRLCKLFREKHINAVPYKGAILSQKYYGDLTLRESSDLDFLIDTGAGHIDSIRRLMLEGGYADRSEIPPGFLQTYLKYSREYSFDMMEGDERKFHAEFHWYAASQVFDYDRPLPNAVLFKQMMIVDLLHEPITALGDDGHILSVVSHHGLNQKWGKLKYVLDMAMLLKNSDPTGQKMAKATAEEYGFAKAFHLGFYLAEAILGIEVEGKEAPPADAKDYLTSLFADKKGQKRIGKMLAGGLKIRDNPAAKYRLVYKYMVYALAPSILDYRFIKLPRVLYPLYAVIKPIRLLIARIK